MFVQTVSLACWYLLSFTDRVSGRSSLLLSVLQIVDSRPSWILVLVLGELRSTSRIANILPVCLRLLFGLNTLSCVYQLFLVCGFVFLVDGKKSFVRFHHPICSYSGLRPVFTRFLFHCCACWSCPYLFPMPKKVHVLMVSSSGCLSVFLVRCSKNLIGPVWSGKPLGLFSVTRPYAWFWHLMHLMGRQAPLNLSLAWALACTSALIVWHGEFQKNFDSFGRGKCMYGFSWMQVLRPI